MSDKCGNCDCADKSQCTKQNNGYGVVMVDAEKTHIEAPAQAETGGPCKCGSSCSCGDSCSCGH